MRISSPSGTVLVRARITSRQRLGSVFAPMHWTDQFAAKGRLDALTASLTDPVSGQPALKNSAVRLEKFAARAFGFAVIRQRPEAIDADYWAAARCNGGWRIELAFAEAEIDWMGFARSLFGSQPESEMLAYHDRDAGQHRVAAFDKEHLEGVLFIAPDPVAVSRGWAAQQLEETYANQRERFRIVAGRGGAEQADAGATVCSCFNVGINQIVTAVAAGNATLEAIGSALKAGTNCGSCRSEIRAIIQVNRVQAAE